MASRSNSIPFYVLIVLLLEALLCHAVTTSPKAYWKSMLPKSPVPNALLPYFMDATDKEKPFHLTKDNECRIYEYPMADENAQGNTADFILEKDLEIGTKLDIHFYPTERGEGGFFSRKASQSIPFSSDKFPDVLQRFSIKPNTLEAKTMMQTIRHCENPEGAGEKRLCPTSLESMVDFVISTLGTHDVVAMSTTAMRKKGMISSNLTQKYTITSPGKKEVKATKYIVCHPLTYPYAVFYCHNFGAMKTYTVPLAGSDGTKLNALVVCHLDTSTWNPRFTAFQVLNLKPGTIPVCHFLPQDIVVWAA